MRSFKLCVILVLFLTCVCGFIVNDRKTFKKCCDTPELLLKEIINKTVLYFCNSTFSDTLATLQFNNDSGLDIGIPEDCQTSDTCIDKTFDNNVVKLFCNSVEGKLVETYPKVYKCCPELMLYESKTKSCVYDDTLNNRIPVDEATIYDLQIGQPKCENALVDYTVIGDFSIKNGVLKMTDRSKYVAPDLRQLKAGTYCVDNLSKQKRIVRVCEDAKKICSKMTCVSKCCEHGNIYQNGAKCLPAWNETFAPKPTDETSRIVDLEGNFAITKPISCKYGRFIYDLHDGHYYPDGRLKIDSSFYTVFDNKFCLENIRKGQRTTLEFLVCFQAPDKPSSIYYFCCLVISCICLAATLIVYLLLPELQNLHGKIVICHSASLLLMYLCLTVCKLRPTYFKPTQCLTLGFSTMFFFVASFAWLNIMCFDIWWIFGVVRNNRNTPKKERKTLAIYCLYAFGIASLITGFAIFAKFYDGFPKAYKPNIGNLSCYFNTDDIFIYTIYLLGPIALMNFFNIMFFILTAKNCIKIKMNIAKMRDTNSSKKQTFLADKATLLMNVKLFIIMGIAWTIEILGYITEPKQLWIFLDSINALQGLWIFCIFIVKAKVWRALRHRCGYTAVREPNVTQTSTVSSKNSYASLANYRTSVNPEESGVVRNFHK